MRLREVIPERADMIELARASETAVGRAYRRALETRLADVQKIMRKRPRVNSTDIHDDVRYQFGLMDGIEYVLRLEELALEEISKPNQEREEDNE